MRFLSQSVATAMNLTQYCAFPLVSHVRGNNGRKIAINNEAMFSHTVTYIFFFSSFYKLTQIEYIISHGLGEKYYKRSIQN